MTNMMNGVVAINGGVGVMEIRQPLPQTVKSVAQPVENLTVNAHISLRELKNTVAAVIEKKLPKYAQLMEMHPVIAARTVVGGATLTAYENGYAVYEEDGAHTIMAIDRCGDYRYIEHHYTRTEHRPIFYALQGAGKARYKICRM